MTRTQFWLLNTVSAVVVLLMLAHVTVSRANSKAAQQLNVERAYINNARQLQPALENLVRRINVAGQNDLQLKALLPKYDIKLNASGDPKPAETNSAPSLK